MLGQVGHELQVEGSISDVYLLIYYKFKIRRIERVSVFSGPNAEEHRSYGHLWHVCSFHFCSEFSLFRLMSQEEPMMS